MAILMKTARELVRTPQRVLCQLLMLFLMAGQSGHLHGAPPATTVDCQKG